MGMHFEIIRKQYDGSIIRDEAQMNNLFLQDYKDIVKDKLDIEYEYSSDLRDYELEDIANFLAYYIIENDRDRDDIVSVGIYKNGNYVNELTYEDWLSGREYML